MKVELLYFEGCPHWQQARDELAAVLAAEGADAEVELRRLESAAEAERERFLGSPTVRVDGTDVDPGAASRRDFGLKCRLYRSPRGVSGEPPAEWIQAAVRRRPPT